MPTKRGYAVTKFSIGLILILVGVLLIIFLIKRQYDICESQWINNFDGFRRKYSSVQNCFWERSSGIILLYIILGIIPMGIGIGIMRK